MDLFMVKLYPFVCIYHSLFVHLAFEEYLLYPQLLVILSNEAVNFCTQEFPEYLFSIFGVYFEVWNC